MLQHTEIFYETWEHIINVSNNYDKITSEVNFKATQGKDLKVLTFKQMLQRPPIAPPTVKACNVSDNLLNEIRQIFYSLYQAQEITKKVCNK